MATRSSEAERLRRHNAEMKLALEKGISLADARYELFEARIRALEENRRRREAEHRERQARLREQRRSQPHFWWEDR